MRGLLPQENTEMGELFIVFELGCLLAGMLLTFSMIFD